VDSGVATKAANPEGVPSARPDDSLQAITWAGFGQIMRHFREWGKVEVIEYMRTLDGISNLLYNENFFDVLVCDIEFLPRHSREVMLKRLEDNLIHHFNPDVKKLSLCALWDKLVPGLKQLGEGNGLRGLPIRWGITDVVLNWERAS